MAIDVIKSRTRFLFVIDNLSTGGAQRQMINLGIGLHDLGHTVEFFCYTQGDLLAGPLGKAGIPIHRWVKKDRFSVGVVFALRKLCMDGKFDLVLSYMTTPNFYAIVAGRLLGQKIIPVVVSERFCDLPGESNLPEKMTRQLYRFASHVVTNSNHQRLNLLSKYSWLKGRISTIYNGYDLTEFHPVNAEPNNRPLKILVVASVSPYKNGLCLIEALNILNKREGLQPQVDWIGQLVMQGERLKYLNEMRNKIEEYDLQGQWNWLNQRLDIVKQLHLHDVLVHPSFGEGLPNVVCEAMACARPVIVSNTLDHAQLIQDGKSGLLFDCDDPADLAKKVKGFSIMSISERKRMGQAARSYAEEHLSSDRLVNSYLSIFTKLIK